MSSREATKMTEGLRQMLKDVKIVEDYLESEDNIINKAVELIIRYSSIDGSHHKQWLIDQILQTLLSPDEYKRLIDEDWDTGIAP